MNLHMPQSYNSKSELGNLTNVSHQIVSPQSNKPVIGIVQDSLVGSRLFTLKSTFFKKREAFELLYSIKTFPKNKEDCFSYIKPTILQPVELYTGKQIFSAILPEMYYNVSGLGCRTDLEKNSEDTIVVIKKGILISGIIDKKTIGAQQGGLIHIIYNDFGSVHAKNFIDNIQNLLIIFCFIFLLFLLVLEIALPMVQH